MYSKHLYLRGDFGKLSLLKAYEFLLKLYGFLLRDFQSEILLCIVSGFPNVSRNSRASRMTPNKGDSH